MNSTARMVSNQGEMNCLELCITI